MLVRGAAVEPVAGVGATPSGVASAATLAGARTLAPARLIAVFQPHLYSRTRLLAREFGRALAAADVIVVLDVYAAREVAGEHPGVSGLAIAEAVSVHTLSCFPVAAHGSEQQRKLLRPSSYPLRSRSLS